MEWYGLIHEKKSLDYENIQLIQMSSGKIFVYLPCQICEEWVFEFDFRNHKIDSDILPRHICKYLLFKFL